MKNNYSTTENFRKLNHFWHEISYYRTSKSLLYKLSKTIRKAEKIFELSDAGKNSDSPLYSETKKVKIFWWKKISKITKRSHAFKGYANSLMSKCCIL